MWRKGSRPTSQNHLFIAFITCKELEKRYLVHEILLINTNLHAVSKHLHLLFLLITLQAWLPAVTLRAQPAPDFSVTDSQGQPHELYADYLDQGKTVVIKLFFSACPPCNAIAPATEQLYQDWGGGQGDVAFISLSTWTGDTDAAINAYKSNHGVTSPGVSPLGGSIAAAMPYQNGTYGFFIGTPTFVVIAPDGSVDFDPRGNTPALTLAAVDAAIAATGAQPPPIALSGSGNISSIGGQGVAQAQLRILELDSTVAMTNNSGGFNFNTLAPPDQSYTLVPYKNTNPANGVSMADLVLIGRHILGLAPLDTPEKRLAADADRNGKITTLDQIALQKIILGINSELPMQPSWLFVRADHSFAQPDSPFEEVYNGTAVRIPIDLEAPLPFEWRAIKVGDVNGDANPRQ